MIRLDGGPMVVCRARSFSDFRIYEAYRTGNPSA